MNNGNDANNEKQETITSEITYGHTYKSLRESMSPTASFNDYFKSTQKSLASMVVFNNQFKTMRKTLASMTEFSDRFKSTQKSLASMTVFNDQFKTMRKTLASMTEFSDHFKSTQKSLASMTVFNDQFKTMRKTLASMTEFSDHFKSTQKSLASMTVFNDQFKAMTSMAMTGFSDHFKSTQKSLASMTVFNDQFKTMRKTLASMTEFNDQLKSVQKNLASITDWQFKTLQETLLSGAAKSFSHKLLDDIKDIQESVSIVEPILSNSIASMDGKHTKALYEGVKELIKSAPLDEVLEQEESNVINVISVSKLKSNCFRILFGLVIIIMASTLEINEIYKFIIGIFTFIDKISTVKEVVNWTKKSASTEKTEIHHHYHIYVNNDEEAEKGYRGNKK